MTLSILRTKDGVPKYDGTPELLPLYKEEAVQYLMTFEHKKRYLAGPRLLQELEGTAKVAVRNKTLRNPQWLSHPRGVYVLLEHLEEVVARPSLVEASRFIMKFFYGLQRKKSETMTSWITRHSEALWKASQALRKVQKEYGHKVSEEAVSILKSMSSQRSQNSRAQSDTGPFREDGTMTENDDPEEEQRDWWSNRGWWDHGWSDWSQGSWHSKEYDPPESWDASTDVFLPEFLVGFLLLHRSGLDTHERANVLAAIRGEFSPESVARALREQWADEDLLRRDRNKYGSALMADQEEEDWEAMIAEDQYHEMENLTESEKEAYLAEQAKVEEAMAVIKTQKSTLREARWKQKQLKLGRGFYPPKPYPNPKAKSGASPLPGDGCFRCGGPHRARDCPKGKSPNDAKVADEEAEIVFSATKIQGEHEGKSEPEYLGFVGEEALGATPAGEVIRSCYGIIDSGATSSLGSIDALEEVMRANLATHGESKMTIDTEHKPVFKFGNGQKKECLSTIKMGIGAGDRKGIMEVHVHDSPQQPVLISRKALKGLGAVIDFEHGLAIYKNVDNKRVVRLTEASNGHLLMPLTGNLLGDSMLRDTAFESLLDH